MHIRSFLVAVITITGCSGNTHTGGPRGPICNQLEVCCPSLMSNPGAQAQCYTDAAAANENDCSSLLQVLQQMGQCGGAVVGGGPSCLALSDCCHMFSASTTSAACLQVVQAGVEASCASALSAFQTQGGCGGTIGVSSAQVAISDNFYTPQTVTIFVGGTVTWTWAGTSPHSTQSDTGLWSSPTQTRGTFSHTFSSPGTFPYHCAVHGTAMRGFVTVNSVQ
jgi:plastocyanin